MQALATGDAAAGAVHGDEQGRNRWSLAAAVMASVSLRSSVMMPFTVTRATCRPPKPTPDLPSTASPQANTATTVATRQ